jgi:hypothetical protein
MPVIRKVSGQGQRQIIPQANIGKVVILFFFQRVFQFIPAFQYFEQQVQVVPAVAFIKVLHVFKRGREDSFKSVA